MGLEEIVCSKYANHLDSKVNVIGRIYMITSMSTRVFTSIINKILIRVPKIMRQLAMSTNLNMLIIRQYLHVSNFRRKKYSSNAHLPSSSLGGRQIDSLPVDRTHGNWESTICGWGTTHSRKCWVNLLLLSKIVRPLHYLPNVYFCTFMATGWGVGTLIFLHVMTL